VNVIKRVRPSPAEQQAMQERVARLQAAVQAALTARALPAKVTVQGSIAKDTWLAGATDVDVFVLFSPDTPPERLPAGVSAVAKDLLLDVRQKYAQHPYVVGTFEGLQVDLVPAYEVAADAKMTAVDRTPHHTTWVRQHLAGREDEVRLAKQWCKGVGVYGADTATGGVSGYLLEVLVLHLGSFEAFIAWLAADRVPDDGLLVIVDPVDATRNCAAAVQEEVLGLAVEAARAYRKAPTERFFFPPPATAAPPGELQASLRSQEATWLGLLAVPQSDRMDLVLPQFHKAGRTLAEAFARAGFPVGRQRTDEVVEGVLWQWVLADVQLPPTTRHEGPPPEHANADRFRAKWQDHPDRAGPIRAEGGRLVVDLHVRARTPDAWLRQEVPRLQLGKHVTAALGQHEVLAVPRGSFAPLASDFILDRRPWHRP